MSSQGNENPCTLLYHINGQLVDVGNGMITKPKEHLFHGQRMPNNVFRVSVASVKTAYEGLAPPLRTAGEDDESPAQLGQCKNWPLLWPKNLLRVEAAGSTPTTTIPIQGMTTTPPTQLPPPSVVLGESA
jgi:hypothetical protein